jgi:murein DD-endopeptidase MepM/ murein hydrolase activator NlpD
MNIVFPRFFKIFVCAFALSGGLAACSHISTSHRQISSEQQSGLTSSVDSIAQAIKAPSPDLEKAESVFDWPVDRARLSRGFKPEGHHPHLGIDLAAPRKTPVYASHQGMVIYGGRDFRGYGNMILIESGQGWATLYAHLDKILVTEGQQVKMGEPIGLMGNTGHSTGPHLHFEIRKNKGPVDPLVYLPGGQEALRKLASKH